MNNEHSIVLQVYAAKENIQTADDFNPDIPSIYQGGDSEVFKASAC